MKDESFPLTPPGDQGRTHDEIAAEIADHLAAAEAELTKSGTSPENAHEAARKKFGDVEKIKQTCYWIQNGETIMLRWTLISLAAVLCILLGLSVLGNWRTQSQLADEMGKLSAELKSLAAAKQIPPPVQPPPEITGVIYAGSKDTPVSKAEVTIRRTDGSIVRRTKCDEAGKYSSGPLDAGDYCITTKTQNSLRRDLATQSQPLFLYAGSGDVPLDLDARFHRAGLKISVSRTLPQIRKQGKYLIASRLHVYLYLSRMRSKAWTAAEESPIGWPVYAIDPAPLPGPQTNNNLSAVFNLKTDEEADFFGAIPTGPTRLWGALSLNVFPLNEKGSLLTTELEIGGGRPGIAGLFQQTPEGMLDANGGMQWWQHPAGNAWLTKLYGKKVPAYQIRPFEIDDSKLADIDLREGITRLRAEIPEGIEQEIEQAIEKTTDPEEFAALIEKGLLTRPVKLTVVGYEPIEK